MHILNYICFSAFYKVKHKLTHLFVFKLFIVVFIITTDEQLQ